MLTARLFLAAVFTFVLGQEASARPKAATPPILEYNPDECASEVNLENRVTPPTDKRKLSKMMRNRTIVMSSDIEANTKCLINAIGEKTPYVVFEIPKDIVKQVIYAGSEITSNSVFPVEVSTLNETGEVVRTFPRSKYMRRGDHLAVTISPRTSEYYILATAYNEQIGREESTTEISTQDVTISNGFGGTGTNTRGKAKTYDRVYSYDGKALVRIVFPKQPK